MLRKPLRIQYISDLHLERERSFPRLKVSAPKLLLLGDIGCPYKTNYREFLKYCSYNYQWTGVVLGNHEHRYRDYKKTIHACHHAVRDLPNVKILQRNIHLLEEGIMVAGCTLWTKDALTPMMNGGQQLNPRIVHEKDLEWLENTIFTNKHPTIVATHHLPTRLLITEKYKNYKSPEMYASNLEYLLQGNVLAWLCGHSHATVECRFGSVYLGINAGKNAQLDKVIVL